MTTPPNAAPRRLDGRAHLTLVTDQDEPTGPADNEQPAGRHAAPRPLMTAGSATVRALMALGALLSALGLSIGKAEASFFPDQPLEEADPPEGPAPTVAPTRADDSTGGSAGYWAPSTRPVVAVAYTVQAPAPTGRHRKSAGTEGWGEWNPDSWGTPTGRHRKPHTDGKHHHPHKHNGVKIGTAVSETVPTVALAGAAPGKLSVPPGARARVAPGRPDLTPGRV
jgi:hypothetical protein